MMEPAAHDAKGGYIDPAGTTRSVNLLAPPKPGKRYKYVLVRSIARMGDGAWGMGRDMRH